MSESSKGKMKAMTRHRMREKKAKGESREEAAYHRLDELMLAIEGIMRQWRKEADTGDDNLVFTLDHIEEAIAEYRKTDDEDEGWITSVEDLGEWLLKRDAELSNGDQSRAAARDGSSIWEQEAMCRPTWERVFTVVSAVKVVSGDDSDAYTFEVNYLPRKWSRDLRRAIRGAGYPMCIEGRHLVCGPDAS